MIGGAEEFAVAFILCHIQTSSGTWTVITNLFVGALLYTLAWMGLADLLYFVNAMTTIHPKLCQICSSVQPVSMEDRIKYEQGKWRQPLEARFITRE